MAPKSVHQPPTYNTFVPVSSALGKRRQHSASGLDVLHHELSSDDDGHESPRRPMRQQGALRPQKFQDVMVSPALPRSTSGALSRGSTPCRQVDPQTGEYTFSVSGRSYSLTALSIPFFALAQLRWYKLLCVACTAYLGVNALFACLFYLPCMLPSNAYLSYTEAMKMHKCSYWSAFEFSVETISTIGYGELKPAGQYSRGVVVTEAFLSMLVLPAITAVVLNKLLASRRLRHTVVFSQSAVVNDETAPNAAGTSGLYFRVASLVKHPPTDVRVNLFLMRDLSPDPDLPQIEVMELAWRPTFSTAPPAVGVAALPVPYLALPATIHHDIDAQSPLHGCSHLDLLRDRVEVVVVLTATDGTSGVTLSAKHGYGPAHICYDAYFDPAMLRRDPVAGNYAVDLSAFDSTLPCRGVV